VFSVVIRLVQQRKCSDSHLFSHIGDMFRQKPVGITLLKLTYEILYAIRFYWLLACQLGKDLYYDNRVIVYHCLNDDDDDDDDDDVRLWCAVMFWFLVTKLLPRRFLFVVQEVHGEQWISLKILFLKFLYFTAISIELLRTHILLQNRWHFKHYNSYTKGCLVFVCL
jgi:hypothetical protein